MNKKELVLELGVEGGGATVFRTPLGSGGWQFHVESGSMSAEDIDVWHYGCSKPVETIEEALESIGKDGSWIFWFPITVHPEYRTSLLELVQDAASKLSEENKKPWERRQSHNWNRRCATEDNVP